MEKIILNLRFKKKRSRNKSPFADAMHLMLDFHS